VLKGKGKIVTTKAPRHKVSPRGAKEVPGKTMAIDCLVLGDLGVLAVLNFR
jgi:hypothetical protein